MPRPFPAINRRCHATHQWILFMTVSLYVMPKTTEQYLIVRSDKSDAKITNNELLCLRLLYKHEALLGIRGIDFLSWFGFGSVFKKYTEWA